MERNGQEWTKEHTRAASSSSLKPGSLKELLTAILPMNLTSPSPVSLHPKPMASQADVVSRFKFTMFFCMERSLVYSRRPTAKQHHRVTALEPRVMP